MKIKDLFLRFRKGEQGDKKKLSLHFTPKTIMYSAIAAAAVTALMAAGVLKRVDRWAQDSLYQRGGVPDTNIVVIGIDDLAFDFFGP